ncbi:MAG: TonB-dependent receptor [Candidatus Omnitrophica bacterium]|nr:TonB-dependent receptor [Candidatus Omnitrophota bacterium]
MIRFNSRALFCGVFIIFSFLQIGLAFGAENGNPAAAVNVVDLEKIVVTPGRLGTSLEDSPSGVTVISRQEIQKSGARTLDEIFQSIPGINVSGNSIYQGSPQVMMRGIPDQGRTVVLIDGVPLNTSWQGGVQWGMVPVDAVERIELVNGPMSTLYGSGAMGGVINVITRSARQSNEGSLKTSYGSLNTRSSALLQEGKSQHISYAFGGSVFKTDGYVPDVVPTIYSVPRTYEHWNSLMKLTYTGDDHSSLTFGFLHDDVAACRGREFFNIDDKSNVSYLTYERPEGDVQFKSTLFVNDQNWGRQFDTGPNYNYVNMVEKIDDTDFGSMSTMGFALGEKNQLITGFDYKGGMVHLEDRYQTKNRMAGGNGRQSLAALFMRDENKFMDDKLLLTLGLREDYARSYKGWSSDSGQIGPKVNAFTSNYADKDWTALSPTAGLVYHVTDQTTGRMSVGRAFHAPYLKDLYVVTARPTKTVYNNPDLRPETLNSYEVGLNHDFLTGLVGDTSFYYSQGKDFIGTRTLTSSTSMPDNIDQVGIYGIAADLKYKLNEQWSSSAGYVFNVSKINKDSLNPDLKDNYLALEPAHQANLKFTYDNPRVITIGPVLRYVGSMYADNENVAPLKSYYVCDLELSKKLNKNIEVSLIFNDLFNKAYNIPKDSSEVLRSPGRMVTGSVMMKW